MKNSKGMTLVEVLVSVGILSIIMMGVAGFQVYQKIQLQDIILQDMQTNFTEEIEETLSSASSCTSYLPKTATTVNTGLKFTLDISSLNDQIGDFYFNIKSSELEVLSQDSLVEDKTATNDGVFNAIASFELENKNSSRSHLLKKVLIPLKLYSNHGSKLLRDMTCISINSDTAIYIGQICNAYGGIMSDGLNCDIPKHKALATHSHSATLPTQTIDITTDKIQRISIQEAICYIDTLSVLTKNLPGWTGAKYHTRFCKYPGGETTADLSKVLKNSRYPNLQ